MQPIKYLRRNSGGCFIVLCLFLSFHPIHARADSCEFFYSEEIHVRIVQPAVESFFSSDKRLGPVLGHYDFSHPIKTTQNGALIELSFVIPGGQSTPEIIVDINPCNHQVVAVKSRPTTTFSENYLTGTVTRLPKSQIERSITGIWIIWGNDAAARKNRRKVQIFYKDHTGRLILYSDDACNQIQDSELFSWTVANGELHFKSGASNQLIIGPDAVLVATIRDGVGYFSSDGEPFKRRQASPCMSAH